jgi:hypothetical protein
LATAALAACDQGKSTPEPVEQVAAKPEPQPTSQTSPGTYSVTEIDGTKMTAVFAADHTYSNSVHGQKTEAGSWSIVGGRTCLTPSEGEGAVARCYTDSAPDRDGSFTSTPDHGDPITVKKIA